MLNKWALRLCPFRYYSERNVNLFRWVSQALLPSHLIYEFVTLARPFRSLLYFRYKLKFYFSLINSWRYWKRERNKKQESENRSLSIRSHFITPRARVNSIHRMLMEFWHWLDRKQWSFGIGFSFATLNYWRGVRLQQAANYQVGSIDTIFASETFCRSFYIVLLNVCRARVDMKLSIEQNLPPITFLNTKPS